MSDNTPNNPLELSDEDFANLPLPDAVIEIESDEPALQEQAEADAPVEEAVETPENDAGEAESKQEEEASESDSVDENTQDTPEEKEPENKDESPSSTGSEEKPKAEENEDKPAEVIEPKVETPNYEEFYKKVLAPFKANGKTIELKSPEEAIQLMQMGANYTRKMQDIQPHRKVLLMLEKNGLLDEGKLSYLIDLDKKDPEAIKKLVKDSGIDPVDIDTTAETNYLGGDHSVSDNEVKFKTALDEMTSTPDGRETINTIHNSWDLTSKEVLWANPELMQTIHQQRELGVYDLITTEMERQKTLGIIPADKPFLEAYKTVGDYLANQGAFNSNENKQEEPKPEPVAVRPVVPKPTVANEDKAKAASATRSTPRKVERIVNPLGMSDDDFLKQMENRL